MICRSIRKCNGACSFLSSAVRLPGSRSSACCRQRPSGLLLLACIHSLTMKCHYGVEARLRTPGALRAEFSPWYKHPFVCRAQYELQTGMKDGLLRKKPRPGVFILICHNALPVLCWKPDKIVQGTMRIKKFGADLEGTPSSASGARNGCYWGGAIFMKILADSATKFGVVHIRKIPWLRLNAPLSWCLWRHVRGDTKRAINIANTNTSN